jgi:hypothetical protein
MSKSKKLVPVQSDDLTPAAKRRASEAIHRVHELYYVRGGIRDTVDKLQDKQEEAGKVIYNMALYCAEALPKPAQQAGLFLGMCKYAERAYKEEFGVTNVAEALPAWRVYKSNILKGVRLGLDPREHKNEYSLRKAIAEELRGDDGDQQRLLGAQKLLTTLPGRLKPLFVQALEQLDHVPKEQVPAAVEIVRQAVADIKQLGTEERGG